MDGYCANLLHTGDTKEADNPIDNIIYKEILINARYLAVEVNPGGFDLE